MHKHFEVIFPPVEDVNAALATIMAPFDENADDEIRSTRPFWDYYTIGGRWSGQKLRALYGEKRIREFYAWCNDQKITVSGIQCGKPTLNPTSLIPIVDAKWNEMFPHPTGRDVACPLFDHSPTQTREDICELKDLPPHLTASHVIIAGPEWEPSTESWTGPLHATYMLSDTIWNGVNHVETNWDGKVLTAINDFRKKIELSTEDYRSSNWPLDNWLVVTVDYHS